MTEIKPGEESKLTNLIIWSCIFIVLGISVIYSLVGIFSVEGELRLETVTICIAAMSTLVLLTFLYKENALYRLLEHILIGLAIGYTLAIEITNVFLPNWWNRMVGARDAVANWWWLLVIPFGLLWYTQLSKKYVWLSQCLMSFFLGTGVGMAFRGIFNLLFEEGKGQVPDTFRSVAITSWNLQGIWPAVNNLIYIVVCLTVLSYFFFSFRHEKHRILRVSSKMGRIFLMISFGAIFGTTVQGRMSLFIDRLRFLFEEWLKY